MVLVMFIPEACGLAVKMEYAKARSSGQPVHISEACDSMRGQLVCRYCEADLKYTASYKTRADILVSAFFSLMPHKRHSEVCRYNVKSSVEVIVSEAESVDDVEPIFKKVFDQGYEFNLNILTDSLTYRTHGEGHSAATEALTPRATRFSLTGDKIARYIRSATGIAKLRSLLEHSSDVAELSSLIKLKANGLNVSWSDFYYSWDRYDVLVNRLKKLRSGQRFPHPVALHAKIKDVTAFNERGNVKARCYRGNDKVRLGVTELNIPHVSSSNPKVIEKFNEEDEIVIVGVPKLNQRDASDTKRYMNVDMWLSHSQQIAKVSFGLA